MSIGELIEIPQQYLDRLEAAFPGYTWFLYKRGADLYCLEWVGPGFEQRGYASESRRDVDGTVRPGSWEDYIVDKLGWYINRTPRTLTDRLSVDAWDRPGTDQSV